MCLSLLAIPESRSGSVPVVLERPRRPHLLLDVLAWISAALVFPGAARLWLQVDFMLQQALKGLPEADRGQYKDKLREAYKKHLSPRPKVQQKAAPGMQLALASSVTGQALPKEKDPFMDAAAEALAILKQGTTASSGQLQAALDKIKAFSVRIAIRGGSAVVAYCIACALHCRELLYFSS